MCFVVSGLAIFPDIANRCQLDLNRPFSLAYVPSSYDVDSFNRRPRFINYFIKPYNCRRTVGRFLNFLVDR